MPIPEPTTNLLIGVSLVDGDADIRHARQLMLRSANYDVRSYATSAAILADPRSRDYPCIVLDIELNDATAGSELLRAMRASGWRGRAILLDGPDTSRQHVREADEQGDRVMKHSIGDISLVAAIAATIDRSWSGWNAG